MSTAKDKAFDREVTKLLTEKFGAVKNDSVHSTYKLKISTLAGDLFVSPYGSWVAMRFLEPDRVEFALPRVYCSGEYSRHSGKYNVHFDDKDPVELRLRAVGRMLSDVQ